MIAFLNGRFVGKNSTSAFIDVNGVGFEVLMSQSGLMDLPKADSSVSVYTYLHISDTGAALYGFLSSEEVEMFKKLIGVSGIGPKIALAALSTFKPSELISAIVAQDVSRVSKIPGVGKKSAQRIILELKDKSDLSFAGTSGTHEDATASPIGSVRAALLGMGFTSDECDIALVGANPEDSESKLLQYALKKLGN